MATQSSIISFNNVTKKFRKFPAVQEVSFDIHKGEVVGFVGVNGAGKTTTISMLLGFTSPSDGTISVFGERITPASAHRSHRRIGYAAGDMELPLHLTGKQYLKFVMAQSKGDFSKRLALLEKQFSPQLDKKIGTLSRGNKQKIALVAAFVCNPELVVLDEPTSGLDPIMQEAFLKLIEREQTKGVTIFMSSHYLQEVAEVCTRVLLMKNGQIVEDLSSRRLADAGGKTIRLVTGTLVALPEDHVTIICQEKHRQEYTAEFTYKGASAPLLKWLSLIKDIHDIEITERTLEAEFKALYTEGADKVGDDDE